MKTRTGFGQCYNAQTAVTEDYLIVAVQVSSDGVDMHQYQPMVTATETMIDHLNTANGTTHRIGTVLADAATAYAIEASHRGLDLDQALDAVRSAFRSLDEPRRLT